MDQRIANTWQGKGRTLHDIFTLLQIVRQATEFYDQKDCALTGFKLSIFRVWQLAEAGASWHCGKRRKKIVRQIGS
jgi:hypothetical protein